MYGGIEWPLLGKLVSYPAIVFYSYVNKLKIINITITSNPLTVKRIITLKS